MIGKAQFGLAVVGILAVLASGGAVFIGSGVYNIGADEATAIARYRMNRRA